jgi:hypothetical protein
MMAEFNFKGPIGTNQPFDPGPEWHAERAREEEAYQRGRRELDAWSERARAWRALDEQHGGDYLRSLLDDGEALEEFIDVDEELREILAKLKRIMDERGD